MISGIADTLGNIQSMAGMAIGAYHGYRRTSSIGWTVVWAAAGSFSPIITAVVAFAQGFGQPKGSGGHLRLTRNPSGLTKKGKRMYTAIKKGYEHVGETRAKEIASRTVYSAAKRGSRGLVKKKR